MKHWLLQAARVNPYTHKVDWKATADDGSPATKSAPPNTAKEWIRQSQIDGVQGDGYIHTWLVLDKEHEVPDDKRGIRKKKFKPVSAPPEPEVYKDSESIKATVAMAGSARGSR